MVVAQQLSKPGSAVKTDREFAGLFQLSIQSPLLYSCTIPFGRILIRIRPDGASAKTVGQLYPAGVWPDYPDCPISIIFSTTAF